MGFKYHTKITEQQLPQMDTGTVPAILRDLSVSNDADKPLTTGLFKLQAGELSTEDTFIIEDGTGQKVTATAGDLL